MSDKISRRDFLKISGIGITAAAVLTGCGPASRYVVRQSYVDMPEYNQTGKSTYYATTCQECSAGCGLIVRTQEGRAIKIEGNPNHPVNRGKVCSRGLTSVQGLYNPDRIGGPLQRKRGERASQPLTWEAAISTVQSGLSHPTKTAFLLGLMPDHLFDLLSEFSAASGAAAPVRYSALGALEGRATLLAASKKIYGAEQFPYFDLGAADVVFNFGADYLETWLSPLAYSRGFRTMRKQEFGKRGYIVAFGARQSLTASNADEWIPVTPGSEGLVALAIGQIAARLKNQPIPVLFETIDLQAAADAAGLSLQKLQELGELFAKAEKSLAIPGGAALTTTVGYETAQAVLALNVLADNLGKPGGVFLTPGAVSTPMIAAVTDLIQRCQNGEVDTLFIHGCNPVFELPPSLGFEKALEKVKTVISFAPFEDETALLSDFVLPDHTGLESFGYQRMLAGSDRSIYSSIQPVVQPVHNTKATVDVLLAAAAAIPALSGSLDYVDEVDFIQQKISDLIRAGGFYTAGELPSFWSKWLQYGGWWKNAPNLGSPRDVTKGNLELSFQVPQALKEGEQFRLVTFATQMGDGRGANRPWLQETPDPQTTVTWNSWIEIHPRTAAQLGIFDDDIVEITPVGGGEKIEAIVYLYPAIRPDTVAIPFGQGHTALGRWAEGRGANPAKLWPQRANPATDLTISDTVVTITPTGRRRPLARQESRVGVYGDGEH